MSINDEVMKIVSEAREAKLVKLLKAAGFSVGRPKDFCPPDVRSTLWESTFGDLFVRDLHGGWLTLVEVMTSRRSHPRSFSVPRTKKENYLGEWMCYSPPLDDTFLFFRRTDFLVWIGDSYEKRDDESLPFSIDALSKDVVVLNFEGFLESLKNTRARFP